MQGFFDRARFSLWGDGESLVDSRKVEGIPKPTEILCRYE